MRSLFVVPFIISRVHAGCGGGDEGTPHVSTDGVKAVNTEIDTIKPKTGKGRTFCCFYFYHFSIIDFQSTSLYRVQCWLDFQAESFCSSVKG